LPPPAPPVQDAVVATALSDLTRTWAAESNGRVEVAAVRGDGLGAVATLGVRRGRAVEIAPAEALALMAWAAASGGAHGRRRGAAAGRSSAWWALTCLAGLDEVGSVDPGDLGRAAAELAWWWWDAAEPETGWSLRLAVEDPAEGLAWAISAVDASST
jgi:resuscitation-promoting factor RpfA